MKKYFTAPTPAVRVFPDGREVCSDTAAGKREYYNRTREMSARQGELCALCGRFMISPTCDHQDGRGAGGGHRDDRILIDGVWNNAAVCPDCNILKGSRRYSWFKKSYQPVVERMEA